jgi:hypothetical protein
LLLPSAGEIIRVITEDLQKAAMKYYAGLHISLNISSPGCKRNAPIVAASWNSPYTKENHGTLAMFRPDWTSKREQKP